MVHNPATDCSNLIYDSAPKLAAEPSASQASATYGSTNVGHHQADSPFKSSTAKMTPKYDAPEIIWRRLADHVISMRPTFTYATVGLLFAQRLETALQLVLTQDESRDEEFVDEVRFEAVCTCYAYFKRSEFFESNDVWRVFQHRFVAMLRRHANWARLVVIRRRKRSQPMLPLDFDPLDPSAAESDFLNAIQEIYGEVLSPHGRRRAVEIEVLTDDAIDRVAKKHSLAVGTVANYRREFVCRIKARIQARIDSLRMV